jgi:hypothetical protein
MNRKRAEPDAELDERLRLEMLLTELSARFVFVTAETINQEFVDAQRQIVSRSQHPSRAAKRELCANPFPDPQRSTTERQLTNRRLNEQVADGKQTPSGPNPRTPLPNVTVPGNHVMKEAASVLNLTRGA